MPEDEAAERGVAVKARKALFCCEVFKTQPERRELALEELRKLYPRVSFWATPQGGLAIAADGPVRGGLPKGLKFNADLILAPYEEDATCLVAVKNRYGSPGEIYELRAAVALFGPPVKPSAKSVWDWLRSPAL